MEGLTVEWTRDTSVVLRAGSFPASSTEDLFTGVDQCPVFLLFTCTLFSRQICLYGSRCQLGMKSNFLDQVVELQSKKIIYHRMQVQSYE